MNFEFKLPDIGEGIHEAELIEWRVKAGDQVKDGQEIATLNTDKVTVELPSPCDGTIVSLHGKPGEVLVIGTVIAVIETSSKMVGQPSANQRALESMHGAKGHAPAAAASAHKASPPPSAAQSFADSVALRAAASGMGVVSAASARGSANGAAHAHAVVASQVASQLNGKAHHNERIIAGPSTRRLARELGVDLTHVPGSGPNGRILRADVESAASAPAHAAQAKAPGVDAPGTRRIKLAGARATSAKNLFDSVHKSATTTSTFEVRGDGIKRLLAQLAPSAEKRGLKVSPMHLMAKCVAAALRQHERFNATIDEQTGDLITYDRVDLSVAVAAGDRLVVPVIRGVDQRLLFDVVRDIADISQRARDGKLGVSDFKGGTFTLSSTGGLERIQMISTRPIINPPQTAILWCSRITDRPRVDNGQLTAGPMMVCSLSFDHRYIDGAEATRFMNDLAEYLEQPELAIV